MKNLFTIPAKVEDYSTYEVMYTLRSKCAGFHPLSGFWTAPEWTQRRIKTAGSLPDLPALWDKNM